MDDAELLEALGRVTRPRPDWQQQAACRDHHVDMFYIDAGHPREKAAKAICNSCPVAAECLREAFDIDERWGIRGGLNPRERERLARTGAITRTRLGAPKRRELGEIRHGTVAGYVAHRKRREHPCGDCMAGKAAHSAALRARKRGAA